MASLPAFEVRLYADVAIAQMKCIADLLGPSDAVSRSVDLAALRALKEVQDMANAARASLGIDAGGSLQVIGLQIDCVA